MYGDKIMYTKFLIKTIKKIEAMRNGHCGGSTGHCS